MALRNKTFGGTKDGATRGAVSKRGGKSRTVTGTSRKSAKMTATKTKDFKKLKSRGFKNKAVSVDLRTNKGTVTKKRTNIVTGKTKTKVKSISGKKAVRKVVRMGNKAEKMISRVNKRNARVVKRTTRSIKKQTRAKKAIGTYNK